MTNDLRNTLLAIARAAQPRTETSEQKSRRLDRMLEAVDEYRRDRHLEIQADRILGEFPSAQDAQLFAGLKREQGQAVTITAGVNHLWAVRTLTREAL